MKKLKSILSSPYFIAILFALKMLVYYTLIKVNRMEIVIILISLIVWGFIFICFCKSGLKRKRGIFLLIYSLLSLLMFADTMYYNYYNQTVSVYQIFQAKSVAAVPKSFFSTMIPASFLIFIDIPFVYSYFKKYSEKVSSKKVNFKRQIKYAVYIATAVILILVSNPFHSTAIARVNSMEFFTNHVHDICKTVADSISPKKMDKQQILQVLSEVTPQVKKTKYNGLGKGKNLIVIQMEAFQNFVLNKEYNGQELTPNLNKLLKQDTLYFDHYYSNVGKGNTADAEFSSLNSLYPVMDGECYRLFEKNTFNGLPWLLRNQGYYAFAVHGYRGEFWDREKAYPNQGFEDYISEEDMDQSEKIGMGISDKSMFKQLIPILQKQTEPYFSFVITLTNHHPFVLDDQYRTLQLLDEDEGTKFGDYLETVHYTDEAIGQFIADLKAAGLYDNTVIALYGDHGGLNCAMDDLNTRVSDFIGRTYDYDEFLNVPLIINIPGSGVEKTISTTGGQIDFMPTVANIMGLRLDKTYTLGQDIANTDKGFVAFTAYLLEGSFIDGDVMFQISREGMFEGSRAWKIKTGETVDASLYNESYEKALLLKKTSQQILEQNLIANYITH